MCSILYKLFKRRKGSNDVDKELDEILEMLRDWNRRIGEGELGVERD